MVDLDRPEEFTTRAAADEAAEKPYAAEITGTRPGRVVGPYLLGGLVLGCWPRWPRPAPWWCAARRWIRWTPGKRGAALHLDQPDAAHGDHRGRPGSGHVR